MFKKNTPYFWLIGIIIVIAALILAPFFGNLFLDFTQSETDLAIERKLSRESEGMDTLSFQLHDPEQSPVDIHDTVMYGYKLITKTSELLPKYVGNALNCTHCHFAGGNTIGGKSNGISLAGVAAVYPDYNERSKEIITLQERINGCFLRSMNGLPLPINGTEMEAFVTYLHWISKDFPIYEKIPWRGLPKLKIDRDPNEKQGMESFEMKCAPCHGKDGAGGNFVPPLWGPNSFNDGAGMNKIDTFASFIFLNMPYHDPGLTKEEAYDIASFVTKQPRPKYTGHN
jgi:thiosulfate dehydrogenase